MLDMIEAWNVPYSYKNFTQVNNDDDDDDNDDNNNNDNNNNNNSNNKFIPLYAILIIFIQLFWSLQKQTSRDVFHNRFL